MKARQEWLRKLCDDPLGRELLADKDFIEFVARFSDVLVTTTAEDVVTNEPPACERSPT
jgi:hypothetical protein